MENRKTKQNVDMDDELLEKCRKIVEAKVSWGESAIWTNQDFEKLSEQIFTKTSVNLSSATLKRLWGKIKYTSRPTVTTLDTLVQFVGYENWRSFRLAQVIQNKNVPKSEHQVNSIMPLVSEVKPRWWLPMVFVIGGAVLWLSYTSFSKSNPTPRIAHYAEEEFLFKPQVITSGIPNSVIFHYDASVIADDDNLEIQQSWNRKSRQWVDKNEKSATSIYYEPGFFMAKLVVNNQVVKQEGVFIPSQGWLSLVEQSPVPVYFQSKIQKRGVLGLTSEELKSKGIALQPKVPWSSFFYIEDLGEIYTDNFIFETELKNEFNEGSGICQHTEIQIRGEGGMAYVPLSIKGCVSNLHLNDMDGKKDDLSALGVDFSDWVKVRYEVKNRRGKIYINDVFAYDMNLDYKPGKVLGFVYRFQGIGSINYVKLTTVDGKEMFYDDFSN